MKIRTTRGVITCIDPDVWKEMDKLKQQLSTAQAKIAELEGQLSDDGIADLHRYIEGCRVSITHLKQRISSLESELAKYREEYGTYVSTWRSCPIPEDDYYHFRRTEDGGKTWEHQGMGWGEKGRQFPSDTQWAAMDMENS
jgi:hypothetical protein